MNEWENKKSSQDIRYSRYIASWIKVCKERFNLYDFEDWLNHLGLNKEEIAEIKWLADCGKLELEGDAAKFMKSLKES